MPPFEDERRGTPTGGVEAARDPFAAPAPDEPAAWAGVLARWEDDAVHRAYLARFVDLEGLAVAGGRYRAVLAERPGDPVAERYRAEVVKRATVQGLASLPRTRPPRFSPASQKRLVKIVVFLLLSALSALAAKLLLPGATP